MTVELTEGLPPDALNDVSDTLSLLASRRSASAKAMREPGPSPEQLAAILEIAVRVPDHGKLTPWRFIIFEGAARATFGRILERRWQELHPHHGAESLAQARHMFDRAPVVICVVSRAGSHPKIPEWEQQLSAGAVCQTILIAATAMSIGCQWMTDWCAYDPVTTAAMGLEPGERVAGLIYLGEPSEALTDRPRPVAASLTTRWTG
ncbi:MAG: nitroreductase [Aestuariivirgaceae bacterium]